MSSNLIGVEVTESLISVSVGVGIGIVIGADVEYFLSGPDILFFNFKYDVYGVNICLIILYNS